jgi:hypothetical protein
MSDEQFFFPECETAIEFASGGMDSRFRGNDSHSWIFSQQSILNPGSYCLIRTGQFDCNTIRQDFNTRRV